MNLPNRLTLLRLCLIPVCLILLGLGLMLPAAAVFALAAFTDFLDGHIARKRHIVTVFGKFADPVADKALVLTAMIMLCSRGLMPAWAVCVVTVRELLVDGLRMVASGQGRVIAAGPLGKVKTVTQIICVLCAMLLSLPWLNLALVLLMTLMTVLSGADYLWHGRDILKGDLKNG